MDGGTVSDREREAFRGLLKELAAKLKRLKSDVDLAGQFAEQLLGAASEEAKILWSVEALRSGAESLVRRLHVYQGEDDERLRAVSVRSEAIRVPAWATMCVLVLIGAALTGLVWWSVRSGGHG